MFFIVFELHIQRFHFTGKENHIFSLCDNNTQKLPLSQLQYHALKRTISAPEALQFYIISNSSISECAEHLAKMQSDE